MKTLKCAAKIILILTCLMGIGSFFSCSYAATIGGDFNLDGRVDDWDVGILGLNYDNGASAGKTYFEGDANNDGKVDDWDVGILGLNYGTDYILAGQDTYLYDDNNKLVVKIKTDGTRDVYGYPDGLFTAQEALADGQLRMPGDVIKECDINGNVIREFYYGATIIVPDQYLRIQDAIDSASSGDTILVRGGTYGDIAYPEYITMKDGVSLIGKEHEVVVINGTITTADNTLIKGVTIRKPDMTLLGETITLEGSNVSIQNCVVENLTSATGADSGTGISVYPLASNVTIKNTVIYVGDHPQYDRGIYLNQASNVTIESNTIHVVSDPTAPLPEDIACVYSEGSTYTLKNNILTLFDPALSAINANTDTPVISYNCILGGISPATLAHKATIQASPGYVSSPGYFNMPPYDFHLAMAPLAERESPSIALDSGDPLSDFSNEVQIDNKAIDLGAYGNTDYTIWTAKEADFTLDGRVDDWDVDILGASYGTTVGATHATGDANNDGAVDDWDVDLLGATYEP